MFLQKSYIQSEHDCSYDSGFALRQCTCYNKSAIVERQSPCIENSGSIPMNSALSQ